MATPFNEVYDFFLSKVTDYSFVQLNNNGDLEDILFKYLRSSVAKFSITSTTDLKYDNGLKEFQEVLSELEKEILATFMLVGYLDTKIFDTRNMEQILTTREYKLYSQANQLNTMISLKKETQKELSHLLSAYSYSKGIDDLL